MTALASLVLGCLTSILFSLAILRFLSHPLARLLERLRPDQASATFWRSYTQVMLALAPLLCVLLFDLIVHDSDPIARLRYGVIASLGGLLFGLWMVGKRLGRFVEAAANRGSAP